MTQASKPIPISRRARSKRSVLRLVMVGLALLVAGSWTAISVLAANPVLIISSVPLTMAAPVRPQVLIAIGNSASMDGTLSGAIMTGSGFLPSGAMSLNASSSPVKYLVPAGFKPPLQAGDANGMAPYTVSSSGVLADNSASRLNVAKASVKAILQSYIQNVDFALAHYTVTNVSLYNTWVYYMSPAVSNFTFTNNQVAGNTYALNPCHEYLSASATVKSNCTSISSAGLASSATLSASAFIQIDSSSDDPTINDVLYAGNQPSVFFNYGTPNPSSPFPPHYPLAAYNNGKVRNLYPNSAPHANRVAGPTNAGYIAHSHQVLYAQRGFGFGGVQSATSGTMAVTMTSAGAPPTNASIAAALDPFQPFLQPETNAVSSTEIKAAAGQSPTAGLLTRARTYLETPAVRVNSACAPPQYVVLISDGLPTQDLAGKVWPPLGSAAALGYGVSASFNPNGSLGSTNAQALTDTISALQALRAGGVRTFIVGLGAGVDPTINAHAAATLQAMAVAGGTDNYYPATSPAALVANLNSILISVQNGSLSATAAAANSTRLKTGSVEYQARFTSNDSPYQDWTGDIFQKALHPATGTATGPALWSASTLLDAVVTSGGWSSRRLIATWNPSLNGGSGAGVPFRWSNSDPALAISAAQQSFLQPSDALGLRRLEYLRGDVSSEARFGGGTFRNRSHILGDIVDSQPIHVGAPDGPYFTPSYFAFQKTQATRPSMLYVGANDGMLHGFDASTGVEKFAFIPNAVFPRLHNLTAPLYNQSHLFFVNGSPQSDDVKFSDGSWHTLLVGGENGGGTTVYALDITSPASLTSETAVANAVKWEFSDADMGLSYSEPRIAPIAAAPGFAVFFGNGYNSPSNRSILYAVHPQTGQTLAKIDLCGAAGVPAGACSAHAAQGLASVATGNSDGLQGQPVTSVYAGDLQGNLWAVDVRSASPANWSVKLLFQARDASGNPQPITTAPVVTLNPQYPRQTGLFVMFGTGQFLTASDLSSSQFQTIYGVWDKPGGAGANLRVNLQPQTLALVTTATSGLAQSLLTATSSSLNFTNKMGWYADLPTAGQRVMNHPQLLNGAFITSLNTPPVSACGARPSAMLLELDFATGGAFARPVLDIDASQVIDSADRYGGTNPVGIGLGTSGGYASSPTLLGPTLMNQMVKNITLSSGEQQSVLNPNNSSSRAAWWQLQ